MATSNDLSVEELDLLAKGVVDGFRDRLVKPSHDSLLSETQKSIAATGQAVQRGITEVLKNGLTDLDRKLGEAQKLIVETGGDVQKTVVVSLSNEVAEVGQTVLDRVVEALGKKVEEEVDSLVRKQQVLLDEQVKHYEEIKGILDAAERRAGSSHERALRSVLLIAVPTLLASLISLGMEVYWRWFSTGS